MEQDTISGQVYSFVEEAPHWRTIEKSTGLTCPWYTRPCLEWLVQYIKPKMSVFEYGCGKSSEWYAEHHCDLHGVDSNQEWITYQLSQRFETDKQNYIEASSQVIGNSMSEFAITGKVVSKLFDLIIIDGLYRDDCTEYALKHLKPGGYLICDNFEQPSVEEFWPKTRELTKGLPLTIYKEPTHPDWQTAVFHNV